MQSFVSIKFQVSAFHFPIRFFVKALSCSGGHLEFQINKHDKMNLCIYRICTCICLLSKKLFLFFIIMNDNWCHLVAKAQMVFGKVNYVWHEYVYIKSNLSYVTFQGNSEMWSHKTRWLLNTGLIDMKCTVKRNKN